MPRMALALRHEAGGADALTSTERAFLLQLQHQALRYFLDNFHPCGLVLDRQSNHGHRRLHDLCSTAATGMGLIAVALASGAPYNLIGVGEARGRVRHCLEAVLERLPHDHGVVPHFVHSATGAVHGHDQASTIETAWLVAGALWAAAFLADASLEALAERLYHRVDWRFWSCPRGLVRHGKDRDGQFLPCSWDRLNGETAFLYVLAAGAAEAHALPGEPLKVLETFHGDVAGLRFNNADLGLFVFQYSLDLLDLTRWQLPGGADLWAEAALAAIANERICRAAATTFSTYRRFWGLSAGDGPGETTEADTYRCYSPSGPIDGTAHLTATVASVVHHPGAVLDNLLQAGHDHDLAAHGRYGLSNVNVDRRWVARDMVGIDAGAAVLALDNYFCNGRVRSVFHKLPCVQRAVERLGLVAIDRDPAPAAQQLSI